MTPGSSREKDASRVRCYVDGFNLYHAIEALDKPQLKWLNLKTLATSFLETGEVLDKVMFFTSVLKWDEEKKRRHVNYIKAQRAYGIDVVESTFKKSRRFCHEQERFCRSREEKQVFHRGAGISEVNRRICLSVQAKGNDGAAGVRLAWRRSHDVRSQTRRGLVSARYPAPAATRRWLTSRRAAAHRGRRRASGYPREARVPCH